MLMGIAIVVGICLVVLVVLFFSRRTAAAGVNVPVPVAVAVVVVIVAIAAAVDWLLVVRSNAPAEEAAGGTGMMMGEGGGMGGGMGGGGGGMGSGGRSGPRREISQLVRKMAALQEKGELGLESAQVEALAPILTQLQAAEKLSDEEAEAPLASIKEALTDAQKAAVEAVELPRRGRGGGGGGMGGGAAGTATPAPAAATADGGAAPGVHSRYTPRPSAATISYTPSRNPPTAKRPFSSVAATAICLAWLRNKTDAFAWGMPCGSTTCPTSVPPSLSATSTTTG